MYKDIYLIRGISSDSYQEFTGRILKMATELAETNGILRIKIVYTAEIPPGVSIIPFRRSKIASVSVYKEDEDLVDPILNVQGFAGAYRVTEALPVKYEKTWTDGVISPGICLLTLFNRKKGLDHKTFIHRWHHSHTPLSLKIHPLWNYSRNVVEMVLTENSEQFEGIVEEQMQTDRDLLNPFRFFGNPLLIIPRLIAVYTDTKSFIDYAGIETYMAREVVVKS